MEEAQQKPEPGPHQTIDVVEMPPYGRGKLVWKHGDSFFISDSGEVVKLFRVSHGGASTIREMRSWRTVTRERGGSPEDILLVEAGEDHSRSYSPLFGDGWLIHEKGRSCIRFEDLGGVFKVRLNWRQLAVGRPEYAAKSMRSSKTVKYDDPDEPNWSTYTGADGTTLAFRRRGPPPEIGFEKLPDAFYRDLTPKAKKIYDLAMMGLKEPEQAKLPIE